MPRPCCVSCRRGSHTTTRFIHRRLSDIVHHVSSLQLTKDLDRVRSFGGYNIHLYRTRCTEAAERANQAKGGDADGLAKMDGSINELFSAGRTSATPSY